MVVVAAMGLCLVAYATTGGADYGGGVWDLLARGPRAADERKAIERAIAPIWEANHVWLIFLVVLLFTAFPKAFAVVATAFHVPIALALVGMVLRGAAFVFRAYGMEPEAGRARWGRVFGLASLVTPVLLGVVVGGMSSGAVRLVDGRVATGFFAGWTTPFSLAVGLYALALFAMLAAVYLAAEAPQPLREGFVVRAFAAQLATAALAVVVYVLARAQAPVLHEGLAGSAAAPFVLAGTAACAIAVVVLLRRGRPRLARLFAAAEVAGVLLGWAAAMRGHAVLPDLPLSAAGARPEVVRPLVPVLGLGAVVLAPSLWWLLRLFKGRVLPS